MDVDKAVAAAKDAFENGEWGRMNARERGRLMYRYVFLNPVRGQGSQVCKLWYWLTLPRFKIFLQSILIYTYYITCHLLFMSYKISYMWVPDFCIIFFTIQGPSRKRNLIKDYLPRRRQGQGIMEYPGKGSNRGQLPLLQGQRKGLVLESGKV